MEIAVNDAHQLKRYRRGENTSCVIKLKGTKKWKFYYYYCLEFWWWSSSRKRIGVL